LRNLFRSTGRVFSRRNGLFRNFCQTPGQSSSRGETDFSGTFSDPLGRGLLRQNLIDRNFCRGETNFSGTFSDPPGGGFPRRNTTFRNFFQVPGKGRFEAERTLPELFQSPRIGYFRGETVFSGTYFQITWRGFSEVKRKTV